MPGVVRCFSDQRITSLRRTQVPASVWGLASQRCQAPSLERR